MACVDFDVDDYLDEASTEALHKEVDRRTKAGTWIKSAAEMAREDDDAAEYQRYLVTKTQPWTRMGLAADIRGAFYLRDASRMEMLLRALEWHEEMA